MPLIQLVYTSHGSRDLRDLRARNALVAHCHKNNPKHDITGAMYMTDSLCIQCLEGTEKAVIQLYANILKDPRHTTISTKYIVPIRERDFPSWTMGIIDEMKITKGTDALLQSPTKTDGSWSKAPWEDMLAEFKRKLAALKR